MTRRTEWRIMCRASARWSGAITRCTRRSASPITGCAIEPGRFLVTSPERQKTTEDGHAAGRSDRRSTQADDLSQEPDDRVGRGYLSQPGYRLYLRKTGGARARAVLPQGCVQRRAVGAAAEPGRLDDA